MRPGREFSAQLAAHAAAHGDRTALVYVADPDAPADAESLSYTQVHDAACRVGALLQAQLRPGERAMLMYPPGPRFAIGFLGCLYAGVVPVVVPVPDGQRHRSRRLSVVAHNAGVTALLTERSAVPTARQWAADTRLADLPCVATDPAVPPEPGQWRPPARDLSRIAFLQYTSGSTSDPRGVAVTAANLAHNAQVYLRVTGVGADARHGGWLPMHHDNGLIGLFLAPLYGGGTSVQMPASTFLRHPQRWLHLVDRFDLDVSSAPNFAYELCLRRIQDHHVHGLDLSRWHVAMNGAEPIRAATMRAFLDRFGRHGLRPEALSPGYGLAEATLAVCGAGLGLPFHVVAVDPDRLAGGEFHPVPAGPDGEPPAGAREIVSCGRVDGYDLRIVDPDTGRVRDDGRVGEIWLRGPSVARGYWRNPEASRATFEAVTADGEAGFLRTGDLGVRHGGELYVTGRIKEVLIVNGRNLYPQDLEAEARLAHQTVATVHGAAFTVAEDQIVLVHEVRAGTEPLPGIAAAIGQRLAQEFGVSVSVVLVRAGTVDRTTSGKVQRLAVRAAFAEGRLRSLHSALTPQVRAYLAAAGEPVPAGTVR
jgi:acyl-CoA synthetase (AMP-forming)/AMP-acid ligase II